NSANTLIDLSAGQEGSVDRHLPKGAYPTRQGTHQMGLPGRYAGFDGAVPGQDSGSELLRGIPGILVDAGIRLAAPARFPALHAAIQYGFDSGPIDYMRRRLTIRHRDNSRRGRIPT